MKPETIMIKKTFREECELVTTKYAVFGKLYIYNNHISFIALGEDRPTGKKYKLASKKEVTNGLFYL